MAGPVNVSLASILSVISHMVSEVRKIDKEIAKLMKGILQTLISVKGIGDVLAAGIIAEIGDIKRFNNHLSLKGFPPAHVEMFLEQHPKQVSLFQQN